MSRSWPGQRAMWITALLPLKASVQRGGVICPRWSKKSLLELPVESQGTVDPGRKSQVFNQVISVYISSNGTDSHYASACKAQRKHITSVVLLPEMRDLHLIPKKYQTSPNKRTVLQKIWFVPVSFKNVSAMETKTDWGTVWDSRILKRQCYMGVWDNWQKLNMNCLLDHGVAYFFFTF